VVKVDGERNLLYVKGAVPGYRNRLVKVTLVRARRRKEG
jgi:ribosomal protein L3